MSGASSEAARRSVWAAISPVASQAGTGSALPFSVERRELAIGHGMLGGRTVRSPTVTAPGRPADCRREATFTVSPVTV